jgi:hypothetical protein
LTPAKRTIALATILVVVSALGCASAFASAKASITVGSPQPELAAYSVGGIGGTKGSGAVLPDGTVVLASLAASRTTATVCVLPPGGRACGSTATLSAYAVPGKQDTFSGAPEVIATKGADVAVVLEDCCHVPEFSGLGGAVVFMSTNDGKSFSSETPAGSIRGVDAATFADGQIVLASSETSSLNVQALLAPPSVALSGPAHPNSRADGDTSLSTYDGGLLVASDDAHGNTLVEFAPDKSNFNLTSSYGSPVGIFDGEDLAGVSANALLTYSSTSTPGAYLRFFNGKSFGPRFAVPEPLGAQESYWSLESIAGVVHVFFLDRSQGSEIYSETTSEGTKWSQLVAYNSAPTAGGLVPVLGGSGVGLVYETNVPAGPLLAQPILNDQTVTITLARLRAPAGKRTTLNGEVAPVLAGQVVTLERWISPNDWANISAVRESSAGEFSFTVPGVTDTYRVMVADEPGLYLFGYSNSVVLTAIVPSTVASSR